MEHGTSPPPGPPTPAPLAPQPNRVLAEPATVEACRADYVAGADVRQTLAAQEARHH
ncbi:hypothetical protein ACH5A3_21260 [Streptomyces echinatus]|uniref:hypothetical protein n=1 Tax=Streptomyces echinatus TaxID=67293 RepID=UPI0037A75910